jgi:hypothetical protein
LFNYIFFSYGNPSEGIGFCVECFKLIEEGLRLDKLIQELDAKLQNITEKVVETVKRTNDDDENNCNDELTTLVRTTILSRALEIDDDKIWDGDGLEVQIKEETEENIMNLKLTLIISMMK